MTEPMPAPAESVEATTRMVGACLHSFVVHESDDRAQVRCSCGATALDGTLSVREEVQASRGGGLMRGWRTVLLGMVLAGIVLVACGDEGHPESRDEAADIEFFRAEWEGAEFCFAWKTGVKKGGLALVPCPEFGG